MRQFEMHPIYRRIYEIEKNNVILRHNLALCKYNFDRKDNGDQSLTKYGDYRMLTMTVNHSISETEMSDRKQFNMNHCYITGGCNRFFPVLGLK